MSLPIEPEQDPTYLSFRRALGFDNNDLRAVAAQRQAQLVRQHAYAIPGYEDQLRDATKSINDDYLSRGVYGSGQRNVAVGNVLNSSTRQIGQSNSEYAAQQGDIEAELARQIATNQRRLAEESLAARDRLAQDNANVGMQ